MGCSPTPWHVVYVDGDQALVSISDSRGRHIAHGLTEQDAERICRLEALADAVRAGLHGLPDHPWIPGACARPVRDALDALERSSSNQ